MIATEYVMRLSMGTNEYTDDGDVLYGAHGMGRRIAARIIIPTDVPYPIEQIVKELGDLIIKRLEGEA